MTENISNSVINIKITYANSPAIIISMIGIISNMLLLVAFIKVPLKCFRNSATYLVMNLSVCDCLSCLLGPLFHASVLTTDNSTGWRFIYTHIAFWFGIASIVTITSISIDRFLMIAYPLKHRILVERKAMFVWLTIIWIVSLSILVVNTLSGTLEVGKSQDAIAEIICATIVIFSAVMYASTYYKLKKQSRNIALQNSIKCRAQEKRNLKEKHFLKTIVLIACISLVWTVPALILFQFYIAKNHVIGSMAYGIVYINFAVNPFIYIARFPNYRKTFHLVYCSRARGSSL